MHQDQANVSILDSVSSVPGVAEWTENPSTEDSEIDAAFLSALAEDSAEDTQTDTSMVQQDDKPADDKETVSTPQEERVYLYTTAPLGDLPGTTVVDAHVGEYNGKTVRKVVLPITTQEAQQGQYRAQGCIAFTQASYDNIIGNPAVGIDVPRAMPAPPEGTVISMPSGRIVASAQTAYPITGDTDVESSGVEVVESYGQGDSDGRSVKALFLNETPENEAAWQAAEEAEQNANNMSAQLAALKRQLAEFEKAEKEAQAAAVAAKAAAPIPITSELRQKLDKLADIVGQGEDSIARAIVSGVLVVRMPVVKTPKTVDGKPVVQVTHHNTYNGTVNHAPRVRVMSAEVKEKVLHMIRAGHGDNTIAKTLSLGNSVTQGAKAVFGVRRYLRNKGENV